MVEFAHVLQLAEKRNCDGLLICWSLWSFAVITFDPNPFVRGQKRRSGGLVAPLAFVLL